MTLNFKLLGMCPKSAASLFLNCLMFSEVSFILSSGGVYKSVSDLDGVIRRLVESGVPIGVEDAEGGGVIARVDFFRVERAAR